MFYLLLEELQRGGRRELLLLHPHGVTGICQPQTSLAQTHFCNSYNAQWQSWDLPSPFNISHGTQVQQHSCGRCAGWCREDGQSLLRVNIIKKPHLICNLCIQNWIQTCQKFKDAQIRGFGSGTSPETLETRLLCEEKNRKQRPCQPPGPFLQLSWHGLAEIISVAGANSWNFPPLFR